MQKGKFNVVVDAMHGSSAKGAASTRLVDIFKTENAASCNYPNAGHTALKYTDQGVVKFIAKALPTPAILNKFGGHKPKLWIGPNSGYFLPQLKKEMEETGYQVNELRIHERSVLVGEKHLAMEAPGGVFSTERISSTMSGSGAAFIEKAMRLEGAQTAKTVFENTISPDHFMQATHWAMENDDETFLMEVSQGYALSVNHGTHYPFCTYRDCSAQQAFADFCIPPSLIGDIYLNVRSFPIRVGNNYRDGVQVGYSGDFWPDQQELTWEQVARDAEMPTEEVAALAERERTTVTKKIRRVATQSWEYLAIAAKSNGATKLILNFPQYLHWSSYGVKGGNAEYKQLHSKVRTYVERMEEVTNLPVVMIGSGPEHTEYIWRD